MFNGVKILMHSYTKLLLLIMASIFIFQNSKPIDDEIKLYRYPNADREIINFIEREGGRVSKYTPGNFAEVYLDKNLFNRLKDQGINIFQVEDKDRLYADSLYQATINSDNPMGHYHTYQEITDTLQYWQQQYPNIAEVHSIGQTVQGRQMWVMKISDNVSIEEAEPEFKYISTIHGDEVVGKEMLMKLIYLLLSQYGNNARIDDLVNNTEIWIMPDMNFDGTELHQRYNANGADLNRNFPDRQYGNPPYSGHSYSIQQETQNMINFTASHNFVMSANFHGGELVVNYPWDLKLAGDPGVYPYSACPDDITFIDLSLTYSVRNLPMYNTPWFANGITNGSAWYQIHGGMQDWNYFEHNCMEVTIELGDKWPSYTTIPQYWIENKESLLAYMEKVHTGIKGIVTDSLTGLPLDAQINIVEVGKEIKTDPDFGDYYRVISPGVYTVEYSAAGYESKTFYNVQVDSFPATVIDVQLNLQDLTPAMVQGSVASTVGALLEGTVINFNGMTDTLDNSGYFEFDSIAPGDIKIYTHLQNHKTAKVDTVISAGDTLALLIMMEQGTDEVFYNFDDSSYVQFTYSADWECGIPTSGPLNSYSGVNLWATNLGGNYSNNGTLSILETPEWMIMGLVEPKLEFYHWYDFESGYDGGNLSISVDGGENWQIIYPVGNYPLASLSTGYGNPLGGEPAFSGQQRSWQKVTFDFSTFTLYPSIKVRFNAGSDNSIDAPGWYVDDLELFDSHVVGIDELSQSGVAKLPTLTNYPNPFNPVTKIFISLPKKDEVDLKVYDVRGALVKTITSKEYNSGNYEFTWDGTNSTNQKIASGVYFLKLNFDDFVLNRKLLLVR